MKKALTLLLLAPLALLAQDYDYSPAINRNLEMLFDNYLISYNKIINYDPNTSPVDTFGIVEVLRDANGRFLHGREIIDDSVSTNWQCSNPGGVNTVDIYDLQNGNVLVQRDKIYFDANNRDTLIEIFQDTSGAGNLTKVQDFHIHYGNFGIDSAEVTVPGGGVGNEVYYTFRRDAVGRPDSLIAAIYFSGASYPIQTLIYYEGSNGHLDSINLRNNITGQIEEQVRVQNDANGKVYEFSFYERNLNNEWSIYDTYVLSTETFFNLVESAQSFDFSLYPNPAQKEIHLNFAEKASYRIYHLSGTLFAEGEYTQGQTINIEDLPKGVYVLNLELADGSASSRRFVKD